MYACVLMGRGGGGPPTIKYYTPVRNGRAHESLPSLGRKRTGAGTGQFSAWQLSDQEPTYIAVTKVLTPPPAPAPPVQPLRSLGFAFIRLIHGNNQNFSRVPGSAHGGSCLVRPGQDPCTPLGPRAGAVRPSPPGLKAGGVPHLSALAPGPGLAQKLPVGSGRAGAGCSAAGLTQSGA